MSTKLETMRVWTAPPAQEKPYNAEEAPWRQQQARDEKQITTAPAFGQAWGMDAKKWTDGFCSMNKAADYGTMLGWFANAIMAGFDEAGRRADAKIDEKISDREFQKDAKIDRLERALRHLAKQNDSLKRSLQDAKLALEAEQSKHRGLQSVVNEYGTRADQLERALESVRHQMERERSLRCGTAIHEHFSNALAAGQRIGVEHVLAKLRALIAGEAANHPVPAKYAPRKRVLDKLEAIIREESVAPGAEQKKLTADARAAFQLL